EFFAARPSSRKRPHGFFPDSRSPGDPPGRVRSASEKGSQIHPTQHFRAGQKYLPILRPGIRAERPEFGPRSPSRPRRSDHLGKHRLLVRPVQYEKGQSHSPGSRPAADPQTEAPEMASVRANQPRPALPR